MRLRAARLSGRVFLPALFLSRWERRVRSGDVARSWVTKLGSGNRSGVAGPSLFARRRAIRTEAVRKKDGARETRLSALGARQYSSASLGRKPMDLLSIDESLFNRGERILVCEKVQRAITSRRLCRPEADALETARSRPLCYYWPLFRSQDFYVFYCRKIL